MIRIVLLLLALAAPAFAQDPARTVRELGRQENPAMVAQIVPLLAHGRAEVRREAANALGQSFAAFRSTAGNPTPRPFDAAAAPLLASATGALVARVKAETDPPTLGVVADALGRLPHRTAASITEVEAALVPLLGHQDPTVAIGAARGLDSLIRNTLAIQPPAAATLARLRAVALTDAPGTAVLRRLVWLALTAAGPVDIAAVERGAADGDLQVRRRAVLALVTAPGTDAQKRAVLTKALIDPAFEVRYEAVRVFGRVAKADACAPALRALDDVNVHVVLAAIDVLGDGCTAAVGRLAALADGVSAAAWHRGAHAFVSLARVSREEATRRLPAFAEHPVWQVRMYAARGAAALNALARLERMTADPDANVAHAALEGLKTLQGHAADARYIDALGRRDYQLVLFAAEALAGSPAGKEAIPALRAALTRIAAEGRATARDPLGAIVARLREFGDAGPVPPPPPPAATGLAAPTPAASRVRMTMGDGGVVEIELFTADAPSVASRFVQLARQGYYNGLTFHRVLPGFIIQGGSPGANEYMGDGPFTRDELGLRSNVRGTVGLSTRGRNTGDMQIYVNLLDNTRLDHDFTVFGEVTSGIDVIDRVVEGATIARIDVLGPAAAPR
jgi:cyclophilin family peptidyl-prolyl cis-trans isomerase/HEAT repeat protein